MITKYKLEKALNTEDRWTQRLLLKECIAGLNAQLNHVEKGLIADGEAEKRLIGIIPIENPATERRKYEWIKL
jgi:hypothetical protein